MPSLNKKEKRIQSHYSRRGAHPHGQGSLQRQGRVGLGRSQLMFPPELGSSSEAQS